MEPKHRALVNILSSQLNRVSTRIIVGVVTASRLSALLVYLDCRYCYSRLSDLLEHQAFGIITAEKMCRSCSNK